MTKLDAGLITSLPASDPGSAAVWGSKRINPRPQFCLCLAWSGCPSNDDDESKLNAMMNVDYCKLLAHNILNLKIVERRLYFEMLKKGLVAIDFGGTLFL